MTLTEFLGYAAACLVLLTFSMKTMVQLRVVGIVSNVFFIGYATLSDATPIMVLHCILLPLNILRLFQIQSLIRRVELAMQGNLDMEWLKSISTRREVAPGELLVRKGDPAASMIFIVSGAFEIPDLGITLDEGQLIGEIGLLAPNRVRTQTIMCTAQAEVLDVTYEQVKQLYFQNPKFGFYLLQLASRRMLENTERLESEVASYRAAIQNAATNVTA